MLPRKGSNLPRTTGAYTLEEIRIIIDALPKRSAARCAAALAAYAGLRRAKIARLHWEDIEDDAISISRTRWRSHISHPKSAASRNWVPIIPTLR